MSVVAETWRQVFERSGWDTITVAGEGPVDRTVPGLELGAARPPDPDAVAAALADADLVVVENLLTIPMNLPASRVVAAELAGRAAVLHHHDPPWQRERFAHITELPPTDPAWVHVTINRLTEAEFADRGIAATTIYNGFDLDPPPGNRDRTREGLGLGPDERLFFHPVRAIERKNIPAAIAVCERHDATYWLPGPAEDGYQAELDRLLAAARCPIVSTPIGPRSGLTMSDGYAASDLVVFPSTWEGFGNPPVEAVIHGRPAVVAHYPVADELRRLGLTWPDPDDDEAIEKALSGNADADLTRNREVIREHLSTEKLENDLHLLLARAGWKP